MVRTTNSWRNIPRKYPIVVHVIRVVGTRFTFYKACVEKNYMKELSIAGIPRIKSNVRYPPQSEDTTLNAWDLCNSEDRHNTLLMLYSLKKIFYKKNYRSLHLAWISSNSSLLSNTIFPIVFTSLMDKFCVTAL